jgi:hypothetical protein
MLEHICIFAKHGSSTNLNFDSNQMKKNILNYVDVDILNLSLPVLEPNTIFTFSFTGQIFLSDPLLLSLNKCMMYDEVLF